MTRVFNRFMSTLSHTLRDSWSSDWRASSWPPPCDDACMRDADCGAPAAAPPMMVDSRDVDMVDVGCAHVEHTAGDSAADVAFSLLSVFLLRRDRLKLNWEIS